jgi:putative ABC transport system ATP-binding protein
MDVRREIAATLSGNPDYANLVYPFKEDSYNANASVAENLLFGDPVGEEFDLKALGGHEYVRSVLDQSELTETFVNIGQGLGETLVEMLGDLTPDQPLFEQFSFVDEETLQELKNITSHISREGTAGLSEEDKTLLISLAFQVVVDRHRLGLIDDNLQARIVEARRTFRDNLPEDKQGSVAFLDPETFNFQTTVRRNLLMGTVNDTVPNAEETVNGLLFEALDKMGLKEEMTFHATQASVGVGGSRLSQADRQKVVLARSLVKRPDILILNDALSSLDRGSQDKVRKMIYELLPETTVVVIAGEIVDPAEFDPVLTIQNGRLVGEEADEEAPAEEAAEGEEAEMTVDSEAAILANIPLFAGINAHHLKLLAFSSRRIHFEPGEVLIRQGEPGVDAYVILQGEVEIVLGEGEQETVLAHSGENELFGELSLLSDTKTTATIRATTPVSALQIKKEVFLQLMENDAMVASQVARVVSDKLIDSLQIHSEAR